MVRCKLPEQLITLELSVIDPTFNEVQNAEPLLDALVAALDGIAFETIFVDDDSPDGTADRVKQAASRSGNVLCVHRNGRRG